METTIQIQATAEPTEAGTIDQILLDLLRYEEVLGAVAISREGLVLGNVGVDGEDADLVGALGASLAGAADRIARRLGAGTADDITINTENGTVHLRTGGEFAVVLFSERCDTFRAGELVRGAVQQIDGVLTGF